MKSRYYEAELAYLREQGREFARAYPSTAGLLAERSDDPDVERLLEGFAFLSSRVRERIDDSIPELAQQLSGVLVPQLTRFIPPTAIVQFNPDRAMRAAQVVPRGSQVAGVTAREVRCLFQTTSALELLPVSLLDVRSERPSSRTEKVVLKLSTPEHAAGVVGAHRIRLHFPGETPTAMTLRAWFLRHCTEIAVVENGVVRGVIQTDERASPRGAAITPVGFDPASRLLPEQALEHDAFAHAVELFACPAKFAFVDLPALGPLITPNCELHLTFDRPPKLPRAPGKDDLRLHCVPVVNLFPCSADPVRFRPLQPEAIVRAAEHAPTDVEVYEIRSVTGVNGAQRTPYSNFIAFRSSKDAHARYYVSRRVPSVTDGGTDVYLSLVSPRDTHPIAESEILSVDLLCSNRQVAPNLKVGELSRPVRGAPTMAPFTNITAVSGPLYPHDNVELLWRLGAHLGLSRAGLQDPANLRRLLEVYNFAERQNPQLGRVNGQWIDAIRELTSRKAVRLVRGAPVTGTKTIVVLDEANFSATGEVLVFGDILNEVFARRVHINSFNQLTVQLAPSRTEYAWSPRYGDRTIL
jgi:type VI secretion system protein ImpG